MSYEEWEQWNERVGWNEEWEQWEQWEHWDEAGKRAEYFSETPGTRSESDSKEDEESNQSMGEESRRFFLSLFPNLGRTSRQCATDHTDLGTLDFFTPVKLSMRGRFLTDLSSSCTYSSDLIKPTTRVLNIALGVLDSRLRFANCGISLTFCADLLLMELTRS